MGRKDKSGGRAAQTLAMTVGASGGASYDAIVKQGANRDKWIASDHSALVPKLDSLKDEVSLAVLLVALAFAASCSLRKRGFGFLCSHCVLQPAEITEDAVAPITLMLYLQRHEICVDLALTLID